MTIKIIACEVMREELLTVKTKQNIEIEVVPMGLHSHPKKLHCELQRLLNDSVGYEKIILAFGLCGGAAKGLQAGANPLIIPRVHDCISLFLGSRERYDCLSREEPGTFYFTCGWTTAGKDLFFARQRIMEKYGEKKALRILSRMYDGYRRILFIRTGCQEEERGLKKSYEQAEILNLRHETIPGDLSYIGKLVNGPWRRDLFIHIAPYETVREEHFGLGAGKVI
ncbi:DUF1638 domain-containing protein [Sporomusa sp. KB1]|jgi:hypothetical protein|uniref:DUF1638 domain-containing protein n=1 Tax=Sporomusa sp. KB1 TaxID=943346 RepID=UPI0011A6236D|nr:DUF1638 domain-containing protein [Sporomusa sp. KB1]TWH49407.1 uncharacterized protein DUF1638 [Sporomusa sp. KB1]